MTLFKLKISDSTKKAAAIVLICALVLAVAFGVLNQSVNRRILASNIDAMTELALHDQNSIKNSVTLRWDAIEGAAKTLNGRSFETVSEFMLAMKQLTNNIPSADKLIALSSEGTEYTCNGFVRQNSYLAETCAGHTESFVERLNNVTYFAENVHELLTMGVPVDISVCGIEFKWLVCQFPISVLEEELKIDSYGGNGFSSVIDKSGNYVVNVTRSHNFGSYDNFSNDMAEAVFEDFADMDDFRKNARQGTLSAVYTLDGNRNIMVITPMDFADWYFITTVPSSVFSAQTNSILRVFMLLFGCIAVFAAAIAVFLLRSRREKERLRLSEAASKSKTEFLFNMSHDIRTPMNAILGYTNIGLRHFDDPEQSISCFNKIKIAGGHLLNLINDILEMSRIEAGRMVLASEPLDLRKMINTVAQINESLATAKSLHFTLDCENIQNHYVYADELHINEVIINLLSNAIKYTHEGGKVKYTVKQIGTPKDGYARYSFEVADSGIGMSEEFQTHLFEAFSREEAAGVSKIEGAGLGLSIVKRIVDLAGGSISVRSVQGKGSTFTVELPFKVLTEDEIKTLEAQNSATSEVVSEDKFVGKRLLLVEDNEMNREIATEILSEAGFEVDCAEDGELAVQAVADKGVEYYDFILMDIQMPVMNGYEATRAIRIMQDGGRIPIIALSANAFAEDREASLNAGMNDHAAKPINIKQLLATLARFV